MSAVHALPRMQRARGMGRIATKLRDGRTHLATLYEDGCAKIRLPHSHSARLDAVLINTAGGLCGGDDVRWEAEAAPGTELSLTSQACERVYRTNSGPARLAATLRIGPDARLDWLPQETILFEHAALERVIDVDMAPDATFCALEAVLLGREAMGESARHARLIDSWRVRRGGILLHAEATRLGDDPARERDGLSLLAGARAFATLLYVGADAERLQRLVAPAPGLGLSRIGDKLVIRALAPTGLDLRRLIGPIVSQLSRAGALPRLWSL